MSEINRLVENVYVLWWQGGYEDFDIIEVYVDKKDAEAEAKKQNSRLMGTEYMVKKMRLVGNLACTTDEELVEKIIEVFYYNFEDGDLPSVQIKLRKDKTKEQIHSLLQSRQPKEWEDFGYANGWSEDPPEIKKCRELKHETVETSDDPPFRRHNWTVKCYVCKIIYHYDSS